MSPQDKDVGKQAKQPLKEYNTIGGRGSSYIETKFRRNSPQPSYEPEGEPEPEPQGDTTTDISQDNFQMPTEPSEEGQTAQPQGEVYSYKKPDGTTGQFELSNDPEERAKQIASLASGKDAYLLGREKLNEISPELAQVWTDVLRQNTDVIKNMSEQQKQNQRQQPITPQDVMTPSQYRVYNRMKSQGLEDEAQEYFDERYETNVREFENAKRIESLETQINTFVGTSKLDRVVSKFRQLDSSLPDPNRGADNAKRFMQAFNNGYGGYLKTEYGLTDEQIFYGNINHDKIYKQYLNDIGQPNQSVPTQNTVTPQTRGAVNKPISPEALKQIQDYDKGAGASSLGGVPTGQYNKLNTRQMRELDKKDGRVTESMINSFGGALSDYLKRKRGQK